MANGYRDYEWFLSRDLSDYGKQWVAILDQKVVAKAKDISSLLREVKRKFPNQKPLITKARPRLSILSHGTRL